MEWLLYPLAVIGGFTLLFAAGYGLSLLFGRDDGVPDYRPYD